VDERRWFCRTFPELVRRQECLMPLYGEGLKRPFVFAAALRVNDVLSRRRNVGVDAARAIPDGRVLGVAETVSHFPLVDRRDLRGSGLWYDAAMPNSQRVLIEILRWACHLGATALNYVEATALVRRGDGIEGVEARDVLDGRTHTFAARTVCNCAGPWSAGLAARFARPAPRLFQPSLAFNVLLDREPVSASAVAVAPRQSRGRGPVYFLYPAFGRVLAGTAHLPWAGGTDRPVPREEDVHRFLADLNASIPGLDARVDHVKRVFAGLLPASAPGTARLAVGPVIVDHAREGGPAGFVSISGVKFTTARRVAEQTLALLGGQFARAPASGSTGRPPLAAGVDFDRPGALAGPEAVARLRSLVDDESVMTLDDLLLRRTNWALLEDDLDGLRRRTAQRLGWDVMTAARRAV
jgi:glycerol-3-phosphate dehydrogenase